MKVVSISNQKGGVGKTTTTINVGAFLATKFNKRVLLIDMDPQQHLSQGIGLKPTEIKYSSYDVLVNVNYPISQAIQKAEFGFDILPSSLNLAMCEKELLGQVASDRRLKNALDKIQNDYDIVLIDCPPSLGLLTINALVASNHVVVPVEAAYLSMQGLVRLSALLNDICSSYGTKIDYFLLFSRFEGRTNVAKAIQADLLAAYKEKILESTVRKNVKLEECMAYGMPICEYDKNAAGYEDFYNVSKELLDKVL